ncbi:MAG: hypothetical protein CMM12_12205 [Rhodospirillaceae bacterium]|nr:hypothetical protein [Rhodospirillaceae bacterium]MAM69508.1 hypothetical protein [Rhodospirillaceae bacterium]
MPGPTAAIGHCVTVSHQSLAHILVCDTDITEEPEVLVPTAVVKRGIAAGDKHPECISCIHGKASFKRTACTPEFRSVDSPHTDTDSAAKHRWQVAVQVDAARVTIAATLNDRMEATPTPRGRTCCASCLCDAHKQDN